MQVEEEEEEEEEEPRPPRRDPLHSSGLPTPFIQN